MREGEKRRHCSEVFEKGGARSKGEKKRNSDSRRRKGGLKNRERTAEKEGRRSQKKVDQQK